MKKTGDNGTSTARATCPEKRTTRSSLTYTEDVSADRAPGASLEPPPFTILATQPDQRTLRNAGVLP
jgi:hypothetical protein